MKKYLFFRKFLAGSLSFFLLSSNFSFLGVVLEPIVDTTYAVYMAYDPNVIYSPGGFFNYNGIDIDVTGTGVGQKTLSGSSFPGCDTKDIAIWTGSTVQIWSACNVGAITSYGSGSGPVTIGTGGTSTGQISYMGELFQWHRNEPITNATLTGVLASVDSGSTFAGHSLFITGSFSSFGANWATFTGSNSDPLWTNPPCGTGYIMPLSSDWVNAKNILGTNLAYFESTLKLPRAGLRATDGQYISGHGKYWSADSSGANANGLWLDSSGLGSINATDSRQRSIGSSVRCMMNLTGSGSGGGGGSVGGSGTTNYIPGTSYQSPITTTFSNSGQIASSGSIHFSITNDRFMTMSGVTVLSLGLSDKFVLNSPSLASASFSGVLSGNSCSGALLVKKDAYSPVNMVECKLTTPLASFSSGQILSVTLSGVTNPGIPGKYEIGAKLKTSAWDEFFYGETFIRDTTDNVSPILTGVFPMSEYQLLLEFNEPIYSDSFNSSISGSFSPSLSIYNTYTDYSNPKKLFVNTSTQSGSTAYSYNITGIKDFNSNVATVTGSFISYNPTAKDLNYISPYMFSQGKSYTGVSLYGKNNMFSGVTTATGMGFGSGITLSNITIDSVNDVLHFDAVVASDAPLGNKDLSVTVSGTPYRLLNAIWVDKNWDNYVFSQNISPTNFNSGATTGTLKVEFSDVITSIGTLSVDKTYGTTSLIPGITNQTNSGNTLTLTLTGVASGVGYNLTFSGITFSGSKVLNDYNNSVFFSFFDGNYANQILPPIVNYSFPGDFTADVPLKDATATGFIMKVGFDQALDSSTTTSTNIKLKDDAGNEVVSTFAFSGTELTITTSQPLAYGAKYTLSLSTGVKGTNGLSLVGNISTTLGGGHSITFNTIANYTATTSGGGGGGGSSIGITNTNTFFIEKTDPFFQAQDVPRDAKMRVIFNEVIDTTTINTNTVQLYDITNIITPIQKTVSFTYDNDYTPKTLYVSGGTLAANTKYKLVIGSGSTVRSVKNKTLITPSNGYAVEFKTGTGLSVDFPLNVMWDYPSLDSTAFEVGFSSPIDASTVNATSVALYQSGGTKVTSVVNYNHFANSLKLEPSTALLSNTEYKIVLKANLIKDIGGNSIATGSLTNNFLYNSTNNTVEKSYSTVGATTTPFFIDSFWATPTNMEVRFSKPITDALNKSNYVINYCTTTIGGSCTPSISVPLTSATILYNDIERKVTIDGLSIPASTISTQTIVEINLANVRDKFSNVLTTTTQQTVLFSANVGTSFQATTQAIELKANVNPQNNTAGKKNSYFIDFPVSSQLVTGSKIEVSFPNQFDLTSAKFDSGSYVNYVNGDKAKPKFTLVAVTSSGKNILEYTITSHYAGILGANDYIASDIQGIINPIQAKDYTTDGYTAEITTKNTLGVVVSKMKSNPLFIKEALTGNTLKTITIQFKNSSGATLTGVAISGAVVGLNTPSGYEELISNTNGTLIFTGEVNQNYSLFLTPEIRIKDLSNNTYTGSSYISTDNQFINIFLDGNKTIDIVLKDKNNAAEFVTLSGSISGLSGKEITVWVSSPNGFFNKDLGIIGSSTSFELRVPKNAGYTTVGIGPTMAPGTMATSYKAPDFMPPKPLNVTVGTTNIPNLNFAVESPTIDFTVIVKDNSASGKVIPKANVYTYSPSGDSMGLYGQTDSMGQVKFKTKAGVYTYGAYIEGLPAPTEQTITIGATGSYTGNLVVTMPNRTIAGKLLNGNNPVSGVNISAYNETKGLYLNAITDSVGDYKFYVEDGTWKIGGWVQTYGSLTEKTLIVAGDSLTNQNFVITQEGVYTVTGSVNLGSASGTGISGVNIFAESTDNDYTKNFFSFTDTTGGFNLSLKNGTYKLRAYHPQYGEVGTRDITVATTSVTVPSFVIESQKTVTITMTGAGLPTDLSKFSWIVDVFDNTNKKGFNKKIKSLTGYTFENVGSGTYDVKINVTGIGQVFSSGSFVVNSNSAIDINLQGTEQAVSLGGTVYNTGTTTPLQDAYVEVRNTLTKQSFGTKANSGGVFDLKVKKGMNYELTVKKPGYEKSNIFTGTVADIGTALGSIYLKALTTTINISGTVTGSSGSLDSKKAYISLQGVNENGSDTSKWFGQEVTISGSTFILVGVPANFGSGKLIFATEGYEMKTDSIRNYTSANISIDSLSLVSFQITVPKSLPITPSQGGVLSDTDAGMKLTMPSNALGTSTNPGTIVAKETSVIPNTPGGEPVGGKAKEITATDSNGQPITSFNSDVTLELTYSGSEFTATASGITLDEVKNMQVSYYDSTTESWISIPTVVSSNSGTLFENNSGSILLSSLNPGSLVFTLKTQTDHFTLFTALVSTVVANASVASSSTTTSTPSTGGGGGGGSYTPVSLTNALVTTFNSVSQYLGNVTQSIVLKSGTNINSVLSIKRDGKVIALSDLLKSGASAVSNVSKNLVSFAVGDIISTSKEGSLEIALDGYSKMQISPGSSMKIAEVGKGFLSYENLGGSVQYQFDKRDGGKFEYKVKGKTGYATIRGTTLSVTSDSTKDMYKLIEGKIDIYNSFLKKTISLVSGDSYIAYANGTEDTSKIAGFKTTTAPATQTSSLPPVSVVSILNHCGPFGDVEKTSEFCPYITKLNEKGIVRTNATYEPNRSISRAELLKMTNLSKGTTSAFNKLYTYLDIKTTDWWAPYVSTAKRLGYISATNVNFEPNRPITRAEAMKIIINFSGVKKSFDAKYTYGDIKSTDWWAPYISTAKKLGYISATQTKFRPNDSISRAEVAKILYNIFFKQ